MEFARAGAGRHCDEDHVLAKLCEVLKYHLRHTCYDLASAKDLALLSYSSDATSLQCHIQASAAVSAKTVVRKAKDLRQWYAAKSVSETHHIIGKRQHCIDS